MRGVSLPAITILVSVSCLTLKTDAQEKSADIAQLKNEAVEIVKLFAGTLKPQLKHAMQTGGPVLAIDVCSVQAPAIAENLSKDTGWTVIRVSLKPRNSQSAGADTWETSVLAQFDSRQQAGEPANKLVHADIVEDQYRFMKAQPVEPLCLTCHGQDLSTEVANALGEHYADDKATGYTLGQVRGAISLTKQL
jgi:hypothetical protein